MSADELKAVNDQLKAMQGMMGALDWPAMREAMEAGFAGAPTSDDITFQPVSAHGVPAEWQFAAGAPHDTALLYLHGGGYAIGSIRTHRGLTAAIARRFKGRVLSLDYRLAPEHHCPAAIHDAVGAYRFLLEHGAKAERIVIAGDSAGGGLTIATLIAIRDQGLALPAGGWCISPWTDMTGSSGSMHAKAEADFIISPALIHKFAGAYVKDDPQDPRATVLNASLKGLPPLLIQVGTAETLLDDSISLARLASLADVDVKLETWPHMPHVWHAFGPVLGEARAAIDSGAAFLNAMVAKA